MINHGIDLDLLGSIEKVGKEFFMLPLEEKQKYPMAPGTVQGYGQAFVFSEDQKLDWCNMFALGVEPHFIRVPKLWPTKPHKFRYMTTIPMMISNFVHNLLVLSFYFFIFYYLLHNRVYENLENAPNK